MDAPEATTRFFADRLPGWRKTIRECQEIERIAALRHAHMFLGLK
jgi:hypothetical protein